MINRTRADILFGIHVHIILHKNRMARKRLFYCVNLDNAGGFVYNFIRIFNFVKG